MAVETLLTPEVKAWIGTEIEESEDRFAISEEMIYELADAIEDPNPLYLDPEYAQKSRFGGLLCPPLATRKARAPITIDYFGLGQERHFSLPLPFRSYGFNGGTLTTFHRPAYVGDKMGGVTRYVDMYERMGRSGQLLFVVRDNRQTNQRSELVHTSRATSIFRKRPETEAADQPPPSGPVTLPQVSPPGPDMTVPKPTWEPQSQRPYEAVQVGDDLPEVVKGPLTTGHLIHWAAANGNFARIHWDLPFARLRQGLDNVVINGSLKNQYLGQLLMTFAGEEGWMWQLYVEHRGMDYPGDTITAFGKVTEIEERQNGFGYVKADIGLRNNRGEQTATGYGVVILPKSGQALPLVWPE